MITCYHSEACRNLRSGQGARGLQPRPPQPQAKLTDGGGICACSRGIALRTGKLLFPGTGLPSAPPELRLPLPLLQIYLLERVNYSNVISKRPLLLQAKFIHDNNIPYFANSR